MAIQSINPTTDEVIKSFSPISNEDLNIKINLSSNRFDTWKTTTFYERKSLMLEASKVLLKRKSEIGKILTLEMGKPLNQAIAEIEKCAFVCEFYANNSEKYLSPEFIESDAFESYVQFDPLGVLLAVMPWNFPFWQVFRFAAPAIMAGNVCLLKHASNVPLCAIEIENVFTEAGFPESVFTNLLIESKQVELVLAHPAVKSVSLTGSEFAGKKVAAAAGANLKKSILELGGSDPFIVLADADIDKAIPVAVASRTKNNGQSCIAAKRFIIEKSVYEKFKSKLKDEFEKLKIGDPLIDDTDIGPISRKDLRDELHQQVIDSISQGAILVTGGTIPEGKGNFYPPTIIENVKKGMVAYEQELFGPVAILIKFDTIDEAIFIANDTEFGLGSSIWTKNINYAKFLASKIDSGNVFINGLVKSDPRLPFGGVKTSGYGRELSHYGIKEFVNIKTVWIDE